jgi:anthranilate synthase component 1
MKLKIQRLQNSGDLHTPVGLYLALRDLYPGALLLESSDYHSAGNSSSYICLQPLSSIVIQQEKIEIREQPNHFFPSTERG